MKRFNRKRRFALVALLALVVAASAYAFTASNTVPATRAGDGNANITGYTISNVQYQLAADPSTISGVTFVLDAPATQVRAKVLGASTTYSTCSVGAGATPTATCTFATPLPTVLAADNLRIIATS